MAQHFEHPSETDSQTRAQRMTADETRAVIALWQQERVEQTGLTDKPAVPDVAEGLDISVGDVQRLLGEVRAKRLEEERKLLELRRQQAQMRQARPVPFRKYARRSRWVEVHPGIWEDDEPTVNEVSPAEASRLVKALFVVLILGFFFVAPLAFVVYETLTGFGLR